MIQSLWVWGPATLWAAVLFLLSAQEFAPSSFPEINDKVAHFALYAILGGALAFGRQRASRPPSHLVLLAAGLLYGASDELHQSFVPSRSPSPADWLADAAGLLAGYAGLLYLVRQRGAKR